MSHQRRGRRSRPPQWLAVLWRAGRRPETPFETAVAKLEDLPDHMLGMLGVAVFASHGSKGVVGEAKYLGEGPAMPLCWGERVAELPITDVVAWWTAVRKHTDLGGFPETTLIQLQSQQGACLGPSLCQVVHLPIGEIEAATANAMSLRELNVNRHASLFGGWHPSPAGPAHISRIPEMAFSPIVVDDIAFDAVVRAHCWRYRALKNGATPSVEDEEMVN